MSDSKPPTAVGASPAKATGATSSPIKAVDGKMDETKAPITSGADDEDDVEIPSDPAEIIDMDTFQQIRDMDEDEEDDEPNAFSKGIVFGFFEQAEHTLGQMDEALEKKDLPSLSSLGHFLKGSSAALGVIKVQHACELIQHYGNKRDEQASKDLTQDEALSRIGKLLKDCRKEYRIAKAYLQKMYE